MPDVLLSWRDQESPARRQREVRQDIWAPLMQVLNVERFKEVVGFYEIASPEIPTCCVTFRRVAKPVDRYDIGLEISTDPDFHSPGTGEGRNADAIA